MQLYLLPLLLLIIAGVWQSGISERFACMRSLVQFLPAPGAAFSRGGCIYSCDGRDLGLGFLVCCHVVDLSIHGESAASSYVGHESLPLLHVPGKSSDPKFY